MTTSIRRTGGRASLAAAAVLWGMAGICVRSITWGPLSQIAVRSVLSFLVIGLCNRSFRIRLTRKNVLGAVAMSGTGILYITSITMTGAGTAIVLQYIAPILVFLYCVVFRRQRPRISQILITGAVFTGVLLSFLDSMDMTHITGNILGLLSGFCFAAQIIIMSGEGSDSSDSLMLSCILSFVIALPFVFFDSGVAFDTKNILWLLVLGIFQYGMANVLFGRGIQQVSSMEASLILTIEPIFNPIPVAIFIGETMGTKALIGAVIVILGVTAYALIQNKKAKRTEEMS